MLAAGASWKGVGGGGGQGRGGGRDAESALKPKVTRESARKRIM